jgi:hypothetical protein
MEKRKWRSFSSQVLGILPTFGPASQDPKRFRLLEVLGEGDGPRVSDGPASLGDSISEERSAATRAPRSKQGCFWSSTARAARG